MPILAAEIHVLLSLRRAKKHVPACAGRTKKKGRRWKEKLHRANAFIRFSAAFPDFSTAPLRFQSDAGTVSVSRRREGGVHPTERSRDETASDSLRQRGRPRRMTETATTLPLRVAAHQSVTVEYSPYPRCDPRRRERFSGLSHALNAACHSGTPFGKLSRRLSLSRQCRGVSERRSSDRKTDRPPSPARSPEQGERARVPSLRPRKRRSQRAPPRIARRANS